MKPGRSGIPFSEARSFVFNGKASPSIYYGRAMNTIDKYAHANGTNAWLDSPTGWCLRRTSFFKRLKWRDPGFEDALSVLERCEKSLNRRYLQRWAVKLGVSAELKYIPSL